MARIKGIGLKFGQLLEEVDVLDVATLARHDPQVLHGRLRDHHAAERLTRRSPIPAEVEDWVNQASGKNHTLKSHGLAEIQAGLLRSKALTPGWSRESNV